ncbi:polysaccharide export outer membrane protein [Altererythrobacter atlanticus]|uniref:Polysaccharide biosynthesis/export protein n=1 Tax=Croceibacterium atlanticum TaxID=1267766 RepID=A0A0F7KUH2_9SPHN|nr:polysaccharide biosynthesis/export family protein [Croceibacterium atlanticum]AKH42836.1 Polysaccharide biosynthesis/export protein [Croceibacterium atlanticum]MBB5731616.1 polysaccharide export outer membrane protein [Croceibacterium atlanticum]
MRLPRGIMQVLGTVALGAMATGCTSTGQVDYLPPAQETGYTLDSGDELRVQVYGLEGFEGTSFIVDESGMLSLPLIDKVPARGKTTEQLEGDIRQALLDRQILKEPFVDVQSVTLRPFYILGEVNNPGEYAYRPGMTVTTAVTIAGGYTVRANQKDVVITRKVEGRAVTGRAEADATVRPGDQIQVVERWF